MPATVRDIQAALQRKTSFELINEPLETDKQLRLEGRVIDDKMKTNIANWHLLIVALSDGAPGVWSVDISKKYFRRGNVPIYTWRLIFQGEDLKSKYDVIAKAIVGSPNAAGGQLSEFPLFGVPADRNPTVRATRGGGR
jgi:hypothetical protein